MIAGIRKPEDQAMSESKIYDVAVAPAATRPYERLGAFARSTRDVL
jgi:hypothetical protein